MERFGTTESARLLLQVYVAGIAALAGLAAFTTEGGASWVSLETLVVLGGLAFLAGARPVRFPWFKFQLTVTHPFIFLAIAQLDARGAVIVALAGLAGTFASQSGTRRLIRVVFNVGSVVLATLLAAWTYHALRGHASGSSLSAFWPLTAAGAAYFFANTGLLAVAVGLERRLPMLGIWRDGFQWTAASYFTGLTVAAVALAMMEAYGPWSLALSVPPCWLLVAFYEGHRETIEERERRIAEVEALNAGLELKVAERTREIEEAHCRLVEASRSKSEFIANVSHELRTPLNAVIGFSDYLAGPDFDNLTERQRGFLADIRDSGDHLLNLINDLLDFAKIEAGRLELHAERVVFADLLREGVAMLRVAAERKKLTLSFTCSREVTLVDLDPKLMKQVVLNLLSNAVKFTDDGGRVTLSATRHGDSLVMQVEDDGIGIPTEHLPRIFEEFHQVDGSYARKHQGTGLGLALVKRMLELHGGTVTVHSEPGKGATFTCRIPGVLVDLPASVDVPHEAAFDPPPPEPAVVVRESVRGGAILVVEDNDVSRKLARNMLRSRGYEVLEASSGEAALELLKGASPALVLMDMQLPGLDGLEVTRRIKANPRTAGIPVVALLAQGAAADEARALAAGCNGFLAKPIRLASFPTQVAAYLEGVA